MPILNAHYDSASTSEAYDGLLTEPEKENQEPLDRELIERWRNVDERAAADIVERHSSALARFAMRLGQVDDV